MPDTLDSIKIRDLEVRVYQSRAGYRFSLDSLLLADFPRIKSCRRILELGSGGGVVSLLLARRYPRADVLGVEIQEGLYRRAVKNAAINGLSDRVEFRLLDLKALPETMPLEAFDLVVANPPFRRPGTGRISPGEERATARHELAGDMRDVLGTASAMLRNRGRLCLVYGPERLAGLMGLMSGLFLEPKRLRTVHSRLGGPARMVLVEAVKRGSPGLAILPPLFIYEGRGVYTPEMREFYGLPKA